MLQTGKRSLQSLVGGIRIWPWNVPADLVGELLNVNDAETRAAAEGALAQRITTT